MPTDGEVDPTQAIERLRRLDQGEDRRVVYAHEQNWRHAMWAVDHDCAAVAGMLLDSQEIDEQWLREKWGFRDYGPYRIANLDWRGPLITYWTDSINEGESRLSMSDSRLSMNRGKFTALMFSLGQYPKRR